MSTIRSSVRSEPRRPRPPRETGVLRVGPWRAREFAAIPELQAAPHVATIDEACEEITRSEVAPELVLLAQALPGAVRQQDVDRLQRLAPLARIVIVAGSWCEGELRTGRPPTGALRLYWYELAPWWQAAQRRLAAGRAPAWSAPLDHPQAGRYLANRTPGSLSANVVAIHADDYSVFECFADAGVRAVWTRGETIPTAQAGVFDGGQLSSRELERLTRFCRQVPGPIAVLLDFPRVEHFDQAKASGAAAVFAKPYIIEEVLSALLCGA